MAALPGRPARPMTINSSVNSVYRRRPDRPWNRPYRPRYGPYYWNYHHHHWDYDCWYWGTGYADSFYGDVPFGWLLGSAYGVAAGAFSNPYDVADSSPSVYDYSQPVLVSATTEDVSPADDPAAIDASVPIAVTSYFDAARGAFQQGDYPAALAQVDEAIREMPDDAVLHEFRALMFFAMKRYDEAAQVLYSVLAAGPGWDWQTLSSCYANAGTYATQLHALEKYVQQNPKSAAANFVLGYQYMCLGNLQAAAARFQVVTQLQPSDRLSAAFVKRLTRQAAK